MCDLGLLITRRAVWRQLGAMPSDLYLLRLIHHGSRAAFPGDRRWTAAQLASPALVRFLRGRNGDGYDIYILPYAGADNAGYILVDLDWAGPTAVDHMRRNGHQPCAVVRTSPGHLQAWVQVSRSPMDARLASAISKRLARDYNGDPASTGWNHIGRLAGFTNQKSRRRSAAGDAPFAAIVHAVPGLASNAAQLLDTPVADTPVPGDALDGWDFDSTPSIGPPRACALYCGLFARWRILQRYPDTDWSIVDLWMARELLANGVSADCVADTIRLASPGFPRRHGGADGYLRRTLARAAFIPPPRPVWPPPSGTAGLIK